MPCCELVDHLFSATIFVIEENKRRGFSVDLWGTFIGGHLGIKTNTTSTVVNTFCSKFSGDPLEYSSCYNKIIWFTL